MTRIPMLQVSHGSRLRVPGFPDQEVVILSYYRAQYRETLKPGEQDRVWLSPLPSIITARPRPTEMPVQHAPEGTYLRIPCFGYFIIRKPGGGDGDHCQLERTTPTPEESRKDAEALVLRQVADAQRVLAKFTSLVLGEVTAELEAKLEPIHQQLKTGTPENELDETYQKHTIEHTASLLLGYALDAAESAGVMPTELATARKRLRSRMSRSTTGQLYDLRDSRQVASLLELSAEGWDFQLDRKRDGLYKLRITLNEFQNTDLTYATDLLLARARRKGFIFSGTGNTRELPNHRRIVTIEFTIEPSSTNPQKGAAAR